MLTNTITTLFLIRRCFSRNSCSKTDIASYLSVYVCRSTPIINSSESEDEASFKGKEVYLWKR